MELNTSPVRVTMAFSVHAKAKMIVVEHSDIGNAPLGRPLYDDACDAGVVLWNPDTNVTTRWYIHEERVRTVHDEKAELEVTVFKSCPETVRKLPKLAGWTLHVLND